MKRAILYVVAALCLGEVFVLAAEAPVMTARSDIPSIPSGEKSSFSRQSGPRVVLGERVPGTDSILFAKAVSGSTDWAKRYAELAQRVEPNMDEPKGYPAKLEPYLSWLDRKARDRDDVKRAMEDAFSAAHGSPEWGGKLAKLLEKAQRSGENTAWDACFKLLRIKKDDNWQNTLFKAKEFGRPIYSKAAETKFDPGHVRDEWVRCLIRYAIGNVEIDKFGLYEGRESVFAEWDKDGFLVIPKRDFDVNCERRIDFKVLQKGEPQTPADRGMEWVEEIRKECDWWRFGRERADATQLMVEYFKDVLCFMPRDKSHQWYVELARKYALDEAVQYAKGFYATLQGTVWVEDTSGRKPAEGALVTVTDPRDGKTWKAKTDFDGRYQIKEALLHAHKDPKGRPRCPVFKISAQLDDDRVDDTFEGKLGQPDPGATLTKNLVIKRKKRKGDLEVDIRGSVNWVHDYPKHRVSLVTNIAITGTMTLHAEKHSGAYQSYDISNMQMQYTHLFKVHRKVPDKDCPETLEEEVKGAGTLPVTKGSLTIRYPRPEARRTTARQSGISFDFTQNAPGQLKSLIGCKYMTKEELGILFGRFQVVDSSAIHKDQKEISGSVSFGIDPGRDPNRFMGGVPFLYYDDKSSEFKATFPTDVDAKEMENILASGDLEKLKNRTWGFKPGNDGRLTWKIKKIKHKD